MDFDFPQPPTSAYGEVRARVWKSIRRQRRIRGAVRAIAAMAACVALMTALVALRGPMVLPDPPMLARAPGVQSPVVVARASPVRHRVALRRKEAPAQPLMVRLETDDPNVVILWTVN